LPITYEIDNESLINDFTSSLIDTIIVKDLIPRYKIQNPTLLKEIFLFLVNNAGNITNLAGILNYLASNGIKTNYTTLALYVEALESAYLVYEVNLYDLQGKKIFDRERKFYVGDHIFKKVFFSSFDTGLGKVLENIVYLAGLRHNYTVYVGKIKENEIDFVFEKNGKKLYLQVCYLLSDEEVIQREF
jgi:predicted AAA+ superfamily ATPase